MSTQDKRYHRITFENSEVAAKFAKAVRFMVLIHLESVDGLTVRMSSEKYLNQRWQKWIQYSEAPAFGKFTTLEFNKES